MTKIVLRLAFVALFFVHGISVLAATDDASDPSSLNLVNLDYYLHPGLVRVAPTFSSAITEVSGTTNEYFTDFALTLGYGLPVDGLRVNLSANDSIYAATNGGSSYYSKGISDPTVDLNYRLVDATPGGVSVDGQLSFSPSIGTRYQASASHPGSNFKGYTSLGASGTAFWRLGLNEVRFQATLTGRTSGTDTSQIKASNTYTTGSNWLASLGLVDRIHLAPRLFLEGQGLFHFGYSNTNTFSDGDSTSQEVPAHLDPEVVLGFLATKQVLFQTFIAYQGFTTTEVDTNDSEVRDTSWGLSAVMEF